jgi:hypothetical protein
MWLISVTWDLLSLFVCAGMVLWTVLFFWNLQGWFISLQGSVLLTEEQIYPSHLGPLYTMDFTTGLYHLRYERQELHEIQRTSIYDTVCICCTVEQLLMSDLAFQGGLCLKMCKMTWRLCSTVFCLCSWDVLGQDILCVWLWTHEVRQLMHISSQSEGSSFETLAVVRFIDQTNSTPWGMDGGWTRNTIPLGSFP